MKIGLQATNIFFEGPKHAGVSRTSLRLLEASLKHTEHEYVVFVRHDSPIPPHWLELSHVKVVRAWAKTRSWHWIGRDLEPIKHRLKAWFSVSGFVPRTPGLVKGSFIHDIFWHKYSQTYTQEDIDIHRQMSENNAKYATFLASNSHSTEIDFEQMFKYPTDRVIVLPLGIGQDISLPLSQSLARPASVANEKEYLFTISTIEPRKNLPRLFGAFAQIVSRYPNLDLVVAGAKGWKTEGIIETVTELGIQDRVHFLGFVPDEEIPALFQNARVAVTASLEEGFGLPVLEAMTFGTVIASSNSGALTEVGGDVPYYFDPTNLDSMVQGITSAIETEDREARIGAGIQRSKLFSWEASARAVLERIELEVKRKKG